MGFHMSKPHLRAELEADLKKASAVFTVFVGYYVIFITVIITVLL